MSKDFDKLINTIICGDSLDVMKDWPDGFIDCCVTSPPYWGLRDYGTATWEGGDTECNHMPPDEAGQTDKPTDGQRTHPGRFSGEFCWKCGAKRIDNQYGLEKTPEEYVAKMVEVFAEVKRVLKPGGTLWLNLGDSYVSGKSRYSSSPHTISGGKDRGDKHQQKPDLYYHEYLKDKDLCGIPWRVAFALQQDGWWLRQDIIWSKPNPMPESVTDRCTKAHEYIFLMSKSAKYYYDAEAIREDGPSYTRKAGGYKNHADQMIDGYSPFKGKGGFADCDITTYGRNKRSVWTIPTAPYSEAHFATFPPKLIEPCILAGCPGQVCKKCGKARERIVEKGELVPDSPAYNPRGTNRGDSYVKNAMTPAGKTQGHPNHHYKIKTVGWTECGCNAYSFRPGIVFDPFMGSGTVAEVAIKLKRNYIGCELKQEYIDMGRVYAAETGVPVAEQRQGQMALFEASDD